MLYRSQEEMFSPPFYVLLFFLLFFILFFNDITSGFSPSPTGLPIQII